MARFFVLVTLVLLAALPAAAQHSPVFQAARDAGASSADAATLAVAMRSADEEAKLIASDGQEGDRFGTSVSLSGDRALVGAFTDDDGGDAGGSAYVFVRSGDTWTEEAKLVASDATAGDNFGFSVSLSGGRALIGAGGDDDVGNGSGSAYVFVRSGSIWTEEAKLTASDGGPSDQFGYSVALLGDRALIGSYFDDDGAPDSGAAYVFLRSGSTWTEEAKLTASDPALDDRFGSAVSLWGDRALIGAFFGVDRSGSAYVFLRAGTTWSEEAKLSPADNAEGDEFGISVSLSDDRALVGAHLDDDGATDSGSAYVFLRSGTTWSQETKITASDALEESSFGYSVSLLSDRALIGAFQDSENGNNSGSAYAYARSGSTWGDEDKFTASDIAAADRFGISVSLSEEHGLIGARSDDDNGSNSGSAYVFDLAVVINIDDDGLADGSVVGRAFPNPALGEATVAIQLSQAQQVRAEVFNVLGQRVAVVLGGPVAAGMAVPVSVDVTALAPGSYIVRLVGETFVASRHLTVLR